MATDFLDLDSVTDDVRKVRIFGVDYTLRSMTVEEFLAEVKADEARKTGEDTRSAHEKFSALVDKLSGMIDAPVEVLVKLSMRKVETLMEWVRGEDSKKEAVAPR